MLQILALLLAGLVEITKSDFHLVNLHQLKGGENDVSQMLVAMSRMRVSQILYNLSPRTNIFIHSGFCLFEEKNNLRSWLISVSTDLDVSDGKLSGLLGRDCSQRTVHFHLVANSREIILGF